MERFFKPSRIMFLAVLLIAMTVLTVFVLFDLTAVQAEEYLSKPGTGSVASTVTVRAARGSILDRNGTLLASDRTVYNVSISRSLLLREEKPNDTVLSLVRAAAGYGVSYTDTFPVTQSAPFEFIVSPTRTQQSRLAAYLKYYDLDEDISAPELISWLRDHYKIQYTVTAEDARRIIGVRYELEIRAIVNTTDYVFASDVSGDFVTWVLTERMPSVSVDTTYERVYYSDYAKHVVGTVGPIFAEEYQERKEQGYSMNSIIGKNGAEAAFEQYLRGRDGSVTVYTDRSGAVVDQVVNTPVSAGSNVYLSIDIGLNQVAEESLANIIAQINETRIKEAQEKYLSGQTSEYRQPELSEGGAVVVTKVTTGEVMAMASYPNYSISTWNRATQGAYEPGSTFKPVVAWAGLSTGTITPETTVKDEGRYTKYADVGDGFAPICWIYPGNHGTVNVKRAIEVSCNYFFYWLSDQMDIDPIAAAAREFGLGRETGIELGEVSGILASREYKRDVLGEGWWAADTLQASIGQSYHQFTPVQMAAYVSTIANGGTHYKSTVLSYITSHDYSDILVDREPAVMNTIDDPEGYIGIIQEGMRAVVKTGTAASIFRGFSIPLAAKTGTVQSDTAAINTAVFICYAPADDPEIAVAVVVERGGSGSGLAQVAKDILLAYFAEDTAVETVGLENALQP